MGSEVDTQNKHIDRIISKTDKVDDQIALNRARLDRIH
jgi:protein transport protein SEC9